MTIRVRRLTRKEVAEMIGVSVYSVRRNEVRWGLDRARVTANQRLVWYVESVAIEELSRRRLICT